MVTFGRARALYHQARMEADVSKLEARVERIAKRVGFQPRKVLRPNLTSLRQLSNEIRRLPKRRRLSARQARVYIGVLQQVRRRQQRLEFLVALALHRQAQAKYQSGLGEYLAQARTQDELLRRLIERRTDAGVNVHASALGRLSRLKSPLTREEYAQRGRKGAQVRWQRKREATNRVMLE